MNRIFSRLSLALCTASIALAVGCTGGSTGLEPEPEPAGGCEDNLDCAEDEFCHAYLKECVANCVTVTDACAGDTPVCNEDNGGTRPLDDDRFNNVCICSDDSCGAGQICHPEYGVCIDSCAEGDACPAFDGDDQVCSPFEDTGSSYCQSPCAANADCPAAAPVCNLETGVCEAEGSCDEAADCPATAPVCNLETGTCEGCTANEECPDPATQLCDIGTGECFDQCTLVGEQDTCGVDEICVADGTCAAPCDDDLCLQNDELCHTDTAEATFNACVAVETEEPIDPVACPSADALDPRDPDGPVLYFLESEVLGEDVDLCPNGETSVLEMIFDYHDSDGDVTVSDNPATYGQDFILGCDECGGAMNGRIFVQTVEYDTGSDATAGTVFVWTCFNTVPSNLSVQMYDDADNASNALCYVE